MNVQINDCTIRDGGYLFNKNSSPEFVTGVVQGLIAGGIDIIEIGFLQDVCSGETVVYGDSSDARKFIPFSADPSRFTGFCDNSRYSLENLDNYDGKSFEYLKISFAKHESRQALSFVSGAKEKGYKVLANPMDAPSYSAKERSEMISAINEIRPYCFSIVDTFGTMYLDDVRTVFNQIDKELDGSIRIGLHSHNNLQLSNALAETMITLADEADRDIIVDASLYGMGRGAGNASTEVIAAFLNEKYEGTYEIGALFDVIEQLIIPHTDSVSWGYDLPMLVCGTQGAHVDNIAYLKKNAQYSAKEILRIISSMDASDRKRYGSAYSKTDFSHLEAACAKRFDERS